MNVKREKIFAFLLAALLLVVGVVCYAVFPVTSPEEPVRIMLKNSAGGCPFQPQRARRRGRIRALM